jgi:uncharacterized repeat protein (TIGR03803 family)
LILSGNTLYGTTLNGGAASDGAVFALNTDGTGFTNLHSFGPGNNTSLGFFTNADGANPYNGLVLSGSTLYGTTEDGCLSGNGGVFAIKTDGTGFTNLYDFTGGLDGANGYAGLIISGSILYGAAINGGAWGNGTLFALNTDGTGFTHLYSFIGSTDGSSPNNLILAGNTLYGTSYYAGGVGPFGTVFTLTLPPAIAPRLAISLSISNVILTWPANAAAFTLQSTTNPVPAAVWSTAFPPPVIVSGQYTVTNLVSGAQGYYRLSR